MNKKILVLVSMLFVLSSILIACQPQTVVETVEVEVKETVVVEREVEVEKEVEVVVTATPAPPECEPVVTPPDILSPGQLIMTINATIPPVQYVDENGELIGMRVELGEEIARRLCLQVDWVNIQFDAMIPGLLGNRFDLINTGTFFTEERAFDVGGEGLNMIPYELQAIAVSVPNGNPDNVASTEDLGGLRVCVEAAGYEETNTRRINEEQVAEGIEPMDVATFPTFADAFAALQAGQCDAVVSVDATGFYYDQRGEFERALSGIAGSPATLVMRTEGLAEAVADVMNEMLEDGTYDEIFDKWGVSKIYGWENDERERGTYGWDGEFEVY